MAGDASASEKWLERGRDALAKVLPWASDVVAVRGEGTWLVDADGERWLDLASGIAVTTTGHCHPEVVAAISEQASTLIHASVTAHTTPMIELAERIGRLCPFFDEPRVFFGNSGAEAVEAGLKMARQVTGRGGIVAFRGAFHGRTLAATSITTAKGKYRRGYEPLLPSVHIAPYADPLRFGSDADRATVECLAALDELLTLQAPDGNVGAMIVEPVLGEGGYVVPPVAWLEGLRRRCDDHGILLIFDEVQCGVGRTGKPFAAETFGVTPDAVLFAKGIASGMPIGGIVVPAAHADRWPEGSHGSTFGGNPVAAAAALATLDILQRDDLCARAASLGERLLDMLRAAAAGVESVREVRGLGLMLAIEMVDKAAAATVQRRCADQRMLVLTCGPGENVLRLIPPLTITDEDAGTAVAILTEALRPGTDDRRG